MKPINLPPKCPVQVGDVVYWELEPDCRSKVLEITVDKSWNSMQNGRETYWTLVSEYIEGGEGPVSWSVRSGGMMGMVIDREYRDEAT